MPLSIRPWEYIFQPDLSACISHQRRGMLLWKLNRYTAGIQHLAQWRSGVGGGRERGREGGRIWVWIWIWIWIWIWRPILRLTGRLGCSTMASPTTLHIGRPSHVMHSQGPQCTLPLRPPRSWAGWLSWAAPSARVGALRMRGRHPPAHCFSPLPTFLRGCSTRAAAHCSQSPGRYQSRGYGGTALAASYGRGYMAILSPPCSGDLI